MKGRVAKVLVLGGDLDAGEELKHILDNEGYQVEVAASLAAGMRMIATASFGIAVLDLAMFRGNEKVLIEQIQQKDGGLAILGLGELSLHDAIIASLDGQMDAYLRKPVARERLVQVVAAIAGERGLFRNERESLLTSVGQRIRAERKRQALTLKQVAERTRLSVSLISQIERAESAASVTSLYKIASALGVPLQSFFENY